MQRLRALSRRYHAATSALAGRGTSDGQSKFIGQLTENQAMVASYLRAVNEAPPSILSKNRQSPAARRATVAKPMPFAEPYAAAHVVR